MKVDLRDAWVLCCGKRGCGKSTLCSWIIKKNKHLFKDVFVVSPSAFSGFWDDLIPKENVQHSWSEAWLQCLIDKMIAKNKGKNQKSPDFTRVLVILDDVLSSETKAHNSKALKILASRGRHAGISVWVNIHYLTSCSPMMRNCATFIVFGINNQKSIELLHSEFGQGESIKEYSDFVRRNSRDYRFLVINCEAKNTDAKEIYGTLKAPSN